MSLSKKNTTRRVQVNVVDPKLELVFDNDKEYKIKAVRNVTVYVNKVVEG